jgi:hypothetical protein
MVIDTAVHAYIATLPADERRVLAQFAAKMNHK